MYNHDNWDFICYFGGHFVLQFWTGKTKNRAWHGADLESAYPNCVKTTAWQILLKNALQTLFWKMGPDYWKHAVHSLPAYDVFSQSGLKLIFLFFYAWTVRRLCVTGTNLGQRKHNEFRACALLVPSVRQALVWRSYGVDIHTCKNAHMRKMCAEVDAHNKWITFIHLKWTTTQRTCCAPKHLAL